MNTPICFSQYFENKMNVRSFSNVMKSKNFNNDTTFFSCVFKNESLGSNLPEDMVTIFSQIKTNLKIKCKGDFKHYFNQTNKTVILEDINKEFVFKGCHQALCDILPTIFFGTHENKKMFRLMVQDIIFSMRMQHLFLNKYLERWNFNIAPWKGTIESKNILCEILLWLFSIILPSIICLNFYVTTCKLDSDENKLYFFWKNQWQSFCDKKISSMTITKVLQKYEPYCLGTKLKRNHSHLQRMELKRQMKEIPKLHLILKPQYGSRPIVKYKYDEHNKINKYKIKEKLNFLKLLTGTTSEKIETAFPKLHTQWLKFNKPKLYFIKADLTNAFGSINTEKMMRILYESYTNYHTIETNVYMKKKVAQQFKEFIAELRKPLLVRYGSTVYQWKEGLVQGYKYSPALSELYYSYLDKINFMEHLKVDENKIKMFLRVVDDYLYITDCLDDAHTFLKALSNYKNVNYQKTVVNFQHPTIKFSEEIIFLGYSYNTRNLEVSRNNNFSGQICYKIKFTSAVGNVCKFLENRIGQSGIQINSHLFNLQYNSEDLIWQHIFATFCLSANKFCTILAILCSGKDMIEYISVYKKVTVWMTNAMIKNVILTKPKEVHFIYCINHFRYLSWLALYYCAIKTRECTNLVPLIKVEMAKSNCLFGKWREHARIISSEGVIEKHAIKEICRRTDLRAIVKKMNGLPHGFEVYNKQKVIFSV